MQTTTPTFLLLPSQRPSVFFITFMFKGLVFEVLSFAFSKGQHI